MIADLTHVFKQYEALRDDIDRLFNSMSERFPSCVKCKPGCSDCCNALFDLPLVEAMYINRAFAKHFDYGRERSDILEKASEIDRKLTRIKRDLFRSEKNGENAEAIMDRAAKERMSCPLLNSDMQCELYEARPITCRLYGIPFNIAGHGHVCGFSGFEQGHDYPAVQMNKIQARLENMGREIGKAIGSKFELADVYVPLSMALLTNYDEAYFGLSKDAETE